MLRRTLHCCFFFTYFIGFPGVCNIRYIYLKHHGVLRRLPRLLIVQYTTSYVLVSKVGEQKYPSFSGENGGNERSTQKEKPDSASVIQLHRLYTQSQKKKYFLSRRPGFSPPGPGFSCCYIVRYGIICCMCNVYVG